MKFSAMIPFLAFAALVTTISVPGPFNPEQAAKSVFIIDTPHGSGTAFVIRVDGQKVYLMTVKHATSGGGPFTIEGLGIAAIEKEHDTQDATLLSLTLPDGKTPPPVLPHRLTNLKFGETVFSLGYSGCEGLWFDEGRYCGSGRATLTVWYRGSGGPVLDAAGRVIGVSKAMAVYEPEDWSPYPQPVNGHSYFVPLRSIASLVR